GLTDYLPQEYQANKIYLDNYPDPADCRTAIIDAINEGTLMVNYTGHGSAGVWAHEKILRMSDIQLLTNTEKLPFIATMTCGNGYFVFPSGHFNCIAEELLYSPSGGALAILAPTGISYPEVQKWLDRYIFEGIFVDGSTLGVATTQARLSVFEHAGESGVNVIQTFPLFGDPALQLKR
ncbi:MAG: C25 family cysteine peptidase, partial [Planctomycetota bacterium]